VIEATLRLHGKPRRLLATPSFLRLWVAGGLGNAMRWLEMLVAGVFTYEQTRSAFLVAAVAAARTLPLLLGGAIAGAIAEAVNRKTLLVAGFFVMAGNSFVLWLLAASGRLVLWHIVVGGVVAGTIWATEMAVRRRMIGETVEPARLGQAIALDSVTSHMTRMTGPLLGGISFEVLGLAGSYAISTTLLLVAASMLAGLPFRQEKRPLQLSRIAHDIAGGLAVARERPVILQVVLVTVITNAFGFSYLALIPAIGVQDYGASPVLVGLLAASEAIGATACALALAGGLVRTPHPRIMMRGSLFFFAAVALASHAPWYGLACSLLLLGGLGTAAFSAMQSTLILTEAPAEMRSRVMGLVTVGIGTGPLGVLAIGALSEAVGAAHAMLTMALIGLIGLALVWHLTPGLRRP
jgi:MFS family permease